MFKLTYLNKNIELITVFIPAKKHRLNTHDVSIFIITNITYHQLYIRSLYVEYIRHKSYACWMLNNNLYTFSVLLASIIWNFGEIWYYIGILKKSNNSFRIVTFLSSIHLLIFLIWNEYFAFSSICFFKRTI